MQMQTHRILCPIEIHFAFIQFINFTHNTKWQQNAVVVAGIVAIIQCIHWEWLCVCVFARSCMRAAGLQCMPCCCSVCNDVMYTNHFKGGYRCFAGFWLHQRPHATSCVQFNEAIQKLSKSVSFKRIRKFLSKVYPHLRAYVCAVWWVRVLCCGSSQLLQHRSQLHSV